MHAVVDHLKVFQLVHSSRAGFSAEATSKEYVVSTSTLRCFAFWYLT